ncbi:putative Cysteine/Histidine-rich C1 domain family protein [Quillaja saponaria]|uniref:Cysteine/Histidine-rich C1 domain family protein n=1 Tax=Quillaja saponaria TaxID=32244 RepID=A0AAD7M3C0_QUISA|nr:putative Cysteine/Histidine-rich C1 domain family protein [Quillaja saponaria]
MERIFKETLNCNECRQSIKAFANEDDEYFPTQNCAFRCKECDFNLHLLCGPLPCKIEHEDHIHPLTYTDRAVEDDRGVYYCGLCQEERDPRVQVYWCADCNYIADIKCVISEILHILKGELDGVDFRAVGEPTKDADVNMKALDSSLADIMKNLSKDDEQEINVLLAPLRVESDDKVTPNQVQQEHDFRKEYLPYTDKDFHQLMGRLCSACLTNNNKEMVISNREFEQNLVVVDGYMISWKLVPVLTELLGKYKNFTPDNSNFTPEVKAVCIFFLCWVVNSMRKEMVVYVPETKLAYWWYYLNALLHKGFKIDFLIEHLKRVIQAYFGLQAIKQSKEIRDSLDIERASSLLKNNKLTEKLQKLQEGYKQYVTYTASRRPRLIEKCLKEAFELQWSYADYAGERQTVLESTSIVTNNMTDSPEPPTKEDEINKETCEERSEAVSDEDEADEDLKEPNNQNNEFSPCTVKDYNLLMDRLYSNFSIFDQRRIVRNEFCQLKNVDIGGYQITRNLCPNFEGLDHQIWGFH